MRYIEKVIIRIFVQYTTAHLTHIINTVTPPYYKYVKITIILITINQDYLLFYSSTCHIGQFSFICVRPTSVGAMFPLYTDEQLIFRYLFMYAC